MFLSETYSIEDCTYAHDMTSADSSNWTIPSSANASYSTNGMKIQGSSWSDCYLEVPLTKPSSIEFDLIDYSGNTAYSDYLYDTSKDRKFHMYVDGGYTVLDYFNSPSNKIYYTIPKGSHVKINVKTDSIELYVDDVLKITKSNYTMDSPFLFGVTTSTSRYTTYKNIKVKPL